jgi:endonuclease YncB( thermonuclease family)
MYTFMKLVLLISFTLLSIHLAYAQAEKAAPQGLEYAKQCGSPLVESQGYGFRMGKVIGIKDGSTIIIETDPGKTYSTVHLAGIDSKGNEDNIIKFLSDNILGKSVNLFGNKKEESDDSLFAIVSNLEGNYFEINRLLLEKGMAGFVKPGYVHSVSDYTMCVYQQLVEKAKKEKIGIWAK